MYSQDEWNAMMATASFENYRLIEKARVETIKNAEIAKTRADIASQRELQQMRVLIEETGEVSLLKETFSGNILKKLPIEIVEKRLLVPIGEFDEDAILHIIVKKASQQQAIWLTREKLVGKKLSECFQRAGIRFGFNDRTEREIQRLFIVAAAKGAKLVEIPARHGWYWDGNKYCYAGPEKLVWREAIRNAAQ